MAYSSYVFCPLLLLHTLIFIILSYHDELVKIRFLGFFSLQAIILISLYPLLKQLVIIFGKKNLYNWIILPDLQDLFGTILFLEMAVILIIYLVIISYTKRKNTEYKIASLNLFCYLLAIFLTYVLAYFKFINVFAPRYLLYTLIPFSISIGIVVANAIKSKVSSNFSFLIFLFIPLLNFKSYVNPCENWRESISILKKKSEVSNYEILYSGSLIEQKESEFINDKKNKDYLLTPFLYYQNINLNLIKLIPSSLIDKSATELVKEELANLQNKNGFILFDKMGYVDSDLIKLLENQSYKSINTVEFNDFKIKEFQLIENGNN